MNLEKITKLMRRYEKTIIAFNEKYNYDIENLGTEKENRDFKMCLRIWDKLKVKRDNLKN